MHLAILSPVGNGMWNMGLTISPFMLASIRDRRERFRRESTRFLIGSVTLGVAFAGVVFVFGLIVVNDDFAGTPRLLGKVSRELESSRVALATFEGSMPGESTFQRIVVPQLDTLTQLTPGENNRATAVRLNALIANSRSAAQSFVLDSAVRQELQKISSRTPSEARYAAALSNLGNALRQYSHTLDGALQQMSTASNNLNATLPQLRAAVENDDARIAELIKRIAVGIIVCTFFLTILRFVANIYRTKDAEMIRAEIEDLRVRRFYVGIRTSAERPEDLRAIITSFLSGESGYPATSTAPASSELSKEEAGVLKDFIQALLKKL